MSKTLLLTMKHCGGCAAVKQELADAIASGEVEEVAHNSEKGMQIAEELNLDEVPECIQENDDGSYSLCSLPDLLERKGHKH